MSQRLPAPPLAPVRVHGAARTAPDPSRKDETKPVRTAKGRPSLNDDGVAFSTDDQAALAVLSDGTMATYNLGREAGRRISSLVVETCTEIFRGRQGSILDDLAEAWWLGEHGEETARGTRARRPYASLPIADRVDLRERVGRLLVERVPESMGDVAVLEAEKSSIFAIPERALARVSADLYRRAEADPRWRGAGASAACVVFAAGEAAIAHVGSTRVSLVRGRTIEPIAIEHTLRNDHKRTDPDLTEADLARIPDDVVRVLGASDAIPVESHRVAVEEGDVFVLASRAITEMFSSMELLTTVLARGTDAASYLIHRATETRPTHTLGGLSLVIVEVL